MDYQSCFPDSGTPQHIQAHGGYSDQAGHLLKPATVREVATEELEEAGGEHGMREGSEGGDKKICEEVEMVVQKLQEMVVIVNRREGRMEVCGTMGKGKMENKSMLGLLF
ncbi:hypothetical protein LR48_Vigan04g147200 [Vigna angularis]|uniref:Uncharacterized protein n=1 Tax=Phaseolus angularis TaxID=3914 RepID=A0A0L9UFE7_PHAAN|nr:hypothetical protein LR48_Vigan04g147200 [Vigna angularis]